MDTTELAGGEARSDSGLMRSMVRHWKDAASARKIAEQTYVSRFHFQRAFRSDTGETPGRMRRRLLLERADCSLRTTETPVTVIALEANYRSLEGFARAFDARLAFRFSVSRWVEPPATLRATLANLEGSGWLDSLFRGVNFAPPDDTYRHLTGTSVPEMQSRFENFHAAFETFVRKARDENLWDTVWVDADCTPPETFAIGRVIEESLTASIACRVMLHRMMEQFGLDSVDS